MSESAEISWPGVNHVDPDQVTDLMDTRTLAVLMEGPFGPKFRRYLGLELENTEDHTDARKELGDLIPEMKGHLLQFRAPIVLVVYRADSETPYRFKMGALNEDKLHDDLYVHSYDDAIQTLKLSEDVNEIQKALGILLELHRNYAEDLLSLRVALNRRFGIFFDSQLPSEDITHGEIHLYLDESGEKKEEAVWKLICS